MIGCDGTFVRLVVMIVRAILIVNIKVVAENLGCVKFLVVCFLHITNPNPRKKYLLWDKSGPNATFNLIFFVGRVGLGLASSSLS